MTTSMRTRAGALQAVHDPHHGTFDWRGRTLAYEVHGRGDRVVVLMHGLLMDARLSRGVARALAARGYRVVLLDLLGHGESDRPHRAAEYRMDTYVDQVVALLDHLGLDRAVVGGVSLGANVSLLLAARHPERVTALWIEMPVLERAVPAAAMTFVPALVTLHYAMPLARLASRVARVLRRTRHDLVASALAPLASPPDTAAARWRRPRTSAAPSRSRPWSSGTGRTSSTRSATPRPWPARCPTPPSCSPTASSSCGSGPGG